VKLNVYDKSNQVLSSIDLNNLFETEINETLLHQVVVSKLLGERAGTASTKTRAEVAGSTKKLFKQKGTGRARQGSAKAPHLYGGGIAFGPKPRDYSLKVNKKMQKSALIQSLASKIKSNNFFIIEDLNFEEIKTKNIMNILKSFNIGSCLFIDNSNEKLFLSTRNIYKVKSLKPEQLNAYDIIRHENIVISKSALDKLTEKLS